jgi:thymidine phosphorylase
VLDVKTGSGAFLPEPDRGLELARTMIALGTAHGCTTTALLTAMDRPLGRAIGNALEVEEALQTLEGSGPEDLRLLTRALAVEMLVAAGARDRPEALRRVDEAIRSGAGLDRFRQMIEAQGGNPAVVDDPGVLPQAEAVEVYQSPVSGTVQRVEPRRLGQAVVAMGGGRGKLGDPIDHSVGFVVTVKPGSRVAAAEPIASVFARDAAGIDIGLAALREAIVFGEPGPMAPLISHRVTASGVEKI